MPAKQVKTGGRRATTWKPGQSGNPRGRPPLFHSLAGIVRNVGKEIADQRTGLTRLEKVIRRLYTDAGNGRTQAAALLFERGWGRVRFDDELSSEETLAQLKDAMKKLLEEGNNPFDDPLLASVAEHYSITKESLLIWRGSAMEAARPDESNATS